MLFRRNSDRINPDKINKRISKNMQLKTAFCIIKKKCRVISFKNKESDVRNKMQDSLSA